MKNTIKLLGIIAIAAVIGVSFIACGDNDDPLNGTWVSSDGTKMVLDKGSITVSMMGMEAAKGTYTTSGNNITITITQINGAVFGLMGSVGLKDQWYTPGQFKETIINYLMTESEMSQEDAEAMLEAMFEPMGGNMFGSQTGTYTLSGKTLTIVMNGEEEVFTRQ